MCRFSPRSLVTLVLGDSSSEDKLELTPIGGVGDGGDRLAKQEGFGGVGDGDPGVGPQSGTMGEDGDDSIRQSDWSDSIIPAETGEESRNGSSFEDIFENLKNSKIVRKISSSQKKT